MPTGLLQDKLEPRIKKEILNELRNPAQIYGNLTVVDIVLGFLSSGGGRAEKSLGDYVDRVLKMRERPFSRKVNIIKELKTSHY